MELDRDLLEKIRLLDDESLRGAIGNVAQSMGFDPSLVAPYLGDIGRIKETVAGLTQGDFDQIQGAIGEENTRAIVENIRKEMKEK